MIFDLIKCKMSAKCNAINFDFSLHYEMVDDRDILNRMTIGRTNIGDLSKALLTKLLKFAVKNQLLYHLIIDQNLYKIFNNKLTSIQAPAGFIPYLTYLLAN